MTPGSPVAPAGWYPDPSNLSGQRYFDGSVWTDHHVLWPAATPSFPPTWKGAVYGRPPSGSGSLAQPVTRLVARILDGLVMLPVALVLIGIALAIAIPLAGPIFPKANPDPNVPERFPGFMWLWLAVMAASAVTGLLSLSYEIVFTVRYGRTLGKGWRHIRPVMTDGQPLGWGASFGRALILVAAGSFSWAGLLDPLWCVWDSNAQCLHDKAVSTLVVND